MQRWRRAARRVIGNLQIVAMIAQPHVEHGKRPEGVGIADHRVGERVSNCVVDDRLVCRLYIV